MDSSVRPSDRPPFRLSISLAVYMDSNELEWTRMDSNGLGSTYERMDSTGQGRTEQGMAVHGRTEGSGEGRA